jgi:membrane-associated phospholipid phosphatase
MSSGLPGERRLIVWLHSRAAESRLGPHLHAFETGVPYGGASLVYGLLALLALRRLDARAAALHAMAAGVVAWILSDILKLVVERPRPCVHYLACGHHSFPEGPGMVLAAVTVAIWPKSRAIAIVAAVCALADAVAQLSYGSHWPSDLIGAWLLGGACGFAVPKAARALARGRGGATGGE